MGRLVAILAAVLLVFPSVSQAGQASGRFKVGLTIGQGPKNPPHASKYTWGAAELAVLEAGYSDLDRLEKSGSVYWFHGHRGGDEFRIAVSITSGDIVEVIAA
jgi:hypothetical protein